MAFHNVPPNGFPDLPDVEELEAVQKDVKTLKTTTAEQGAAITNLNSTKANKTDIATEFSDLTNYNAGDLVYYEGALYEFQVDHTAGAWETSEVIQKDLSDIVTTLMSGLTELENHNLDGNVIDITSYVSGNTYTTPSDGFVRVSASTEAINVIRKNGVQFCILTGTGTTELSVFVKKGTQLVVDNPSTAKFLPYVN